MRNLTPEKSIINAAERAAAEYDGTRPSETRLLTALVALEAAICEAYQVKGGKPSREQEQAFTQKYAGRETTIYRLIEESEEAHAAFLMRLLQDDPGALLTAEVDKDICFAQWPEIIFLPPEPQEIQQGDGDGEWEAPKFDETRLPAVLKFLHAHDIRLDEIIRHRGGVGKDQIRQRPYDIVEILPWDMQIAVCSQVNNALFVTPKILSIYEWARTGKTALVERFGAKKIEMYPNWLDELAETVQAFRDGKPPVEISPQEIKEIKQNTRQGRVRISDRMRIDFMSELERTGLRGRKIFKLIPNPPDGLTDPTIGGWKSSKKDDNGNIIGWAVQTVREDYFSSVMSALSTARDAKALVSLDENGRREEFIELQKQLGSNGVRLGARNICRLIPNPPDDLNEWTIKGWSEKKQTGKWSASVAQEDHFNLVIHAMRAERDRRLLTSPDGKLEANPRVNLDENGRRERWIAELKRTGIQVPRILQLIPKLLGQPVPEGLNYSIMSSWNERKKCGKWNTSTAEQDHFNCAMLVLSKIPDALYLDKDGRREEFITLQIRLGSGRSKLGGRSILKLIPNPPADLTEQIIHHWSSSYQTKKGQTKWSTSIAVEDHFNLVMDAMRTELERRSLTGQNATPEPAP